VWALNLPEIWPRDWHWGWFFKRQSLGDEDNQQMLIAARMNCAGCKLVCEVGRTLYAQFGVAQGHGASLFKALRAA